MSDPIPFARNADGSARYFKRSTKKNLVRCPHCGQPVDRRYWAEHRERAHKLKHKKGLPDACGDLEAFLEESA